MAAAARTRLDGIKFRRQFVADFCCWDARLLIEVDGVHHRLQHEEDRARRDAIEANGFLEIRFTNDEVMERPDWVIEEIRRALDNRTRPITETAPTEMGSVRGSMTAAARVSRPVQSARP